MITTATNPVHLGTTIGFISEAGRTTRFYEMPNIRGEDPDVREQ